MTFKTRDTLHSKHISFHFCFVIKRIYIDTLNFNNALQMTFPMCHIVFTLKKSDLMTYTLSSLIKKILPCPFIFVIMYFFLLIKRYQIYFEKNMPTLGLFFLYKYYSVQLALGFLRAFFDMTNNSKKFDSMWLYYALTHQSHELNHFWKVFVLNGNIKN